MVIEKSRLNRVGTQIMPRQKKREQRIAPSENETPDLPAKLRTPIAIAAAMEREAKANRYLIKLAIEHANNRVSTKAKGQTRKQAIKERYAALKSALVRFKNKGTTSTD